MALRCYTKRPAEVCGASLPARLESKAEQLPLSAFVLKVQRDFSGHLREYHFVNRRHYSVASLSFNRHACSLKVQSLPIRGELLEILNYRLPRSILFEPLRAVIINPVEVLVVESLKEKRRSLINILGRRFVRQQ